MAICAKRNRVAALTMAGALLASVDLREVPMERPVQLGERKVLTEDEFAARAKGVDEFQTEVVGKGVRPNAGYWAGRQGVDGAAAPPHWQEFMKAWNA